MTEDVEALRRRVSDLEDRVGELAAQLDEPAKDSTQRRESGLDHYDESALERMPRDKTFGFAQVKTSYRNAGIRDTNKIKERADHLVNVGKLEHPDRFNWRVVENE